MSDPPLLGRSDLDNSGMAGAGNAVDVLHVGLGNDHLVVVHDLLNIIVGSGLNNVLNLEPLDALVLGNGPSAVCADYYPGVTTILLVSSIISSFLWHL